MRDPRLSPDPASARRLDAAVDDYAGMPPLTGPPSSSSMSTYRGTTDRHAAARVSTADGSTQAGSSALLSSRRAYWTNEQQQLQQSFERYHSHRQELLQLPYPTPPAAERLPPVSATVPIHRVYILRCATCDTFLSDRGMRAVLLLKPHIILFSTDSAPANSATFWPDGPAQEQVERTCDCLTSSINCHGCGKTVGYNIVSPCSKCNASVQKHQRSANHHRFVFHHNEVTARERTYYPGDPGVSNPIVRLQPSPTPSRDSSRTPTPLSRGRERVESAADKDAPSVRLSRLRTSSPAARARDRGLRLLKPGDTVYWHMLVTGGERSQSIDPRLREPIWHENEGR